MKVTPAHDPNDYQAGLRNKLPMINLLNPDGTYNENAGSYAGLDRIVVRKRVVKDLEAQGLLERVDSYLVRLNHSDRSKTPIEPYLSDQWFVRMARRAGRLARLRAAGDGRGDLRTRRRSTPIATPRATSTGWARSATGASAGSSGGATASPSGIAPLPPKSDLKSSLRRPRRRDLAARRVGRLAHQCRDRPLGRRARSGSPPRPGPGRPRHLVQLGPVAALDARLARGDARAGPLLSDQRALDGPRHHHALGGADGRSSACSTARTCRSATCSSTR